MRNSLLACALLITASAGAAIPSSEREALVALYQSTNGAQWSNNAKWLSAEPECTWYGVDCGEAQTNVLRLYLDENNLRGTLPSSIRNLTKLEELHVYDNNLRGALPLELSELANLERFFGDRSQFTGAIPAAYGALKKLRVLALSGNQLVGPLPSAFGDMTGLEEVNLGYNLINGPVPDLSKLTNLESLDLTQNLLSGTIPTTLGSLTSLRRLVLHINDLTGTIPPVLGNLANLNEIRLGYNELTGGIPSTFGQLRSLERLDVRGNLLSDPLPATLGDLAALLVLDVGQNKITGEIPTSLYRLTTLEELHLGENQFSGPISSQIGMLRNLQVVALYYNQFTGPIPVELTTITPLRSLELQSNHFTGPIPPEISRLEQLDWIDLSSNDLTGTIPTSIGSLAKLQILMLYENELTGTIPPELGRLSNLRMFSVAANHLIGSIPDALRSLTKIEQFGVNGNALTGSIPSWIGEWRVLETLYVAENQLSGQLPAGLATLDKLEQLDLSANQFTGPLPDFTRLTELTYLSVDSNEMSGPLPPSIGLLSKLDYAALGVNHFSGPLPPEIGGLVSVTYFDVTANDFEGTIPPQIGQLKNANSLGLCCNHFSGTIPKELGSLTSLQFLGMSFNALKGPIPAEMKQLTGLEDHRSDFGYNALFTTDASVRDFINLKHSDGDFEGTQTVLPNNIRLDDTTDRSATLSWEPIRYGYNDGGYQVTASTTPTGPPVVVATTSTKGHDSITVRNLNASTTYFFRVATVSHPSSDQENLIVTDRSVSIQGATKQRVIAPAEVILTDAPSGMVQIDRTEVEADSFTLTNFGDVASSITLEKSESFFTISPTQFTLGAGATQIVTLHSTPQDVGTYYGYVAIDGPGTAEDLLAEVVLLSSARPSGTVVATPVETRVELAGAPGSDEVGTVRFSNSGTARLTGIIVSDQPWVVVKPEPLRIDPGAVGAVSFRVARSRRSETEGGLSANLTLIYVSGGESLTYKDILTHDASGVSVSKVTIIDVTKPPVTTGPVPGLPAGQLAFFIPGVATSTGSHADVSIVNAAGASAINDLKLYFTNGPQTSVASMQPLGFAKAIALPNLVSSIYGNASATGSLQIRSSESTSLASEGKVTAVTSAGTYAGSIPVFRGDRSVASGPNANLYLAGLSSPGDLFVQETSGGNTSVRIELRDASGALVTSGEQSVNGYALLELTNAIPANVTTAVIRNLGPGLMTAYARLRDTNGDTWSVVDWSRFYGYALQDAVRIPFADGAPPPGAGGRRRSVRANAIASHSITDVVLYNPGIVEAKATMTMTGASDRTVTVPAGSSMTVTNAGGGSSAATGSLVVTPTKGVLAVTARSHHARGGSAIPVLPVAAGLRLGQSQIFANLADSTSVRTSYGMTESSGKSAKVRVRIIIDESSPLTATITSKTFDLAAGAQLFLPELVRSFAGDLRDTLFGDLHNLTLEFEVIEGDGSVVPFIIATDVASRDSNVIVQ